MDTREQKPLEFTIDHIVTGVFVEKLDIGDYSARYLDGVSCSVCFERKSIGDLFSTLTSGYPRFKKEIGRANRGTVEMVIAVEGSYKKVLGGSKYSRQDGLSVIRRMQTLWLKYGVRHMCFDSRKSMASYIREFFISCGS